MKDEEYRYLFPFEKIKQSSNILIYGAGIVGMEYLKQVLLTNYCNVIGMADKNYKNYSNAVVPVYAPDYIHNLDLDNVVIAQRVATHLDEINSILREQKVPKEKIVCILERAEIPPVICEEKGNTLLSMAYQKSNISIAILVAGGIGDMVIQKKLITEFVYAMPECLIDIFYGQNGEFLEYLYGDCKNINAVIPDLGSRYSLNCSNYTIGLEVLSTRYVHVNVLKDEQIPLQYQEFRKRMLKLQEESQKEKFTANTLVYAIYQRRLYKGLNAYTAFNYNGAFEIQNKKVSIPMSDKDEENFNSLNLGKYVTFNFGNGVCRDGSRISKMWPQRYFVQVVALMKERYPEIKIIQLGEDGGNKIEGADQYFLGADFRLVTYILKNSIFHLDIEGGLVHIASQLGTKCIVLFGPTPKEYLEYEDNINIRAGDCHNCFGLYDEIYKCARNMKEPKCMLAITPEIVMSYIHTYMGEIEN